MRNRWSTLLSRPGLNRISNSACLHPQRTGTKIRLPTSLSLLKTLLRACPHGALIAERLAAGKTVLYVSNKGRALEAAYERLRAAGLGDFCLALDRPRSTRRQLLAELARCLEPPSPADADMPAEDIEHLHERQKQ